MRRYRSTGTALRTVVRSINARLHILSFTHIALTHLHDVAVGNNGANGADR